VILVDTSVWIDHLDRGESVLSERLDRQQVLMHPFVVGEIAMGSLRHRDEVLEMLQGLPQAVPANEDEVLHFIARWALYGIGIGYIDAHLLASTQLTADALLWTKDTRLLATADRLSLAFEP